MKIDQTRLLISHDRLAECFRFYSEVLGLEVTHGSAGKSYASFKDGSGGTLAIFAEDDMGEAVGTTTLPRASAHRDRTAVVMKVENVDEFEPTTEPEDRPGWGIRTAHFRDPDGHLFEIIQYLD